MCGSIGHVLHVRHLEAAFAHHRSLGEAALNVALADLEPVADVGAGLRVDERHALVLPELRVYERGIGQHAGLGVEDGGQRFVLHVDELQRSVCDLLAVGRNPGHRVAYKTHPVQGEDPAVLKIQARQPREVLPGDDCPHSRQGSSTRHVDRDDARVGERAAFEARVQQPSAELQVVHVLRAAGDLFAPFQAWRALADNRAFGGAAPCLSFFRIGHGRASCPRSAAAWIACTMRT